MLLLTFCLFPFYFCLVMKAFVVVLTLLAPSVAHAQVSLDYHVSRGAAVTVNTVPVIRASALQLYAPGWRRSYYSSHARPRLRWR